VDQLSKELEKVLSSLDGENSLSNVLHQNEIDRIQLEKQLSEAKEVAKGMKLVEGLGRNMEEIDHVLSIGDFKSSVNLILNLEERLINIRKIGFSDVVNDMNKVVELVEEQLRLRRSEALSSLRSLWRMAIVIDLNSHQNQTSNQQSSNQLFSQRQLLVYTTLEGHVGIGGQLQLKKSISLDQIWWCLEKLGSDGLLSECCDYISRNFLLSMVSCEIENIRKLREIEEKVKGNKQVTKGLVELQSTLSIEQFTQSTGEQSVMSLSSMQITQQNDDDDENNDENGREKERSPSIISDKLKALRVSVPTQEETQHRSQCVNEKLPFTTRRLLVFLGDVTKALQFIAQHIFNGSLRFSAKAGVLLFGKDPQQGEFLRALCAVLEVATESHDLKDVEVLKVAVSECEQRLFDLGYLADLPASQKECDILGVRSSLPSCPLSIFVAKLPVVWANRMREEVLEGMRAQLVSGDYHNSVDSDGALNSTNTPTDSNSHASPLHFPSCQVTATCAELLRAAHRTLEAACAQTDSLPAATLFRTARELLDLFRAVVPQRHSEALASLPRLAALFHNDCMFLSHASLTLAHPYRSRLPAPLNKTATCVDLAPVLREVGEQTLLKQIAVQQVQLDTFTLDVVWVPEDDAPCDRNPETAVKGLVFHLHHLAHLWQPCLSDQVYGKVMSRLLKHATMPLLEAILSAQDIAESTTHRLFSVLTDLCKAKEALIGSDLKLGEWWSRLCALKNLLVWSLDDINEQLSSGTFRNFSSLELCHILEALFEQTEKLERTLIAVRKA